MPVIENWLELSGRFVARDHGVRERKDAMTREISARGLEVNAIIVSSDNRGVHGPLGARLQS